MKVVHLCYYYGNNTSGAPIAATRLHQALLRAGVESHYICIDQREPGENIHVLPKSPLFRRFFYIVVRAFWVLTKVLTGKMLMPNVLPLAGLGKTIEEINPDVIHAQYIGQDMMSFSQLAALPQPKVFTLHDISIINAIEPYPGKDRRFETGFDKNNSSAIERWMFRHKKKLLAKANMVFTGPSKWVCDIFAQSLLGRGRTAQVVPNIIDPVFSYDASLRKPHEKFTILFGAYGGRSSKYKGWPDLEAALRLLPEEVKDNSEIVIFGEAAEEDFIHGIKVRFVGNINNVTLMKLAHHKADIFAFPSKEETLGQTKIEAMLDGLPVIAFNRTACSTYITHKENGWVAPDGDLKSYADGLKHFYHLFKNGELETIRPQIAAKAKACFSEETIIRQMVGVYSAALAQLP